MKNFIKVVNREVAEELASLGFPYIREGDTYAFAYDDRLISLLTEKYAKTPFAKTNKLIFRMKGGRKCENKSISTQK